MRNISWCYLWRKVSKVFTKLNPVSTLDRFSYFLDHIADNRWRNQKVTSWLLNHRRIIIDKSANFYNTQLHTSHCVACNHDWLQFVYNSSKNLPPLTRILSLPTQGQKSTDSVLQSFTFDNFPLEHPVVKVELVFSKWQHGTSLISR